MTISLKFRQYFVIYPHPSHSSHPRPTPLASLPTSEPSKVVDLAFSHRRSDNGSAMFSHNWSVRDRGHFLAASFPFVFLPRPPGHCQTTSDRLLADDDFIRSRRSDRQPWPFVRFADGGAEILDFLEKKIIVLMFVWILYKKIRILIVSDDVW